MMFLNRNKTSGIVKLLVSIRVTCLIIFFSVAEGQDKHQRATEEASGATEEGRWVSVVGGKMQLVAR